MMFEKITKWLHSDSKKNWNNLKKGDKLYVLIPFVKEMNGVNILSYTCQETSVINIKEYKSLVTNLRFKYTTESGKRKRVNLVINKRKYEEPYLAIKVNTEWAREYKPVFGDTIVIISENEQIVNDVYREIIDAKIDEQEKLVEIERNKLSKLRSIRYDTINIQK